MALKMTRQPVSQEQCTGDLCRRIQWRESERERRYGLAVRIAGRGQRPISLPWYMKITTTMATAMPNTAFTVTSWPPGSTACVSRYHPPHLLHLETRLLDGPDHQFHCLAASPQCHPALRRGHLPNRPQQARNPHNHRNQKRYMRQRRPVTDKELGRF